MQRGSKAHSLLHLSLLPEYCIHITNLLNPSTIVAPPLFSDLDSNTRLRPSESSALGTVQCHLSKIPLAPALPEQISTGMRSRCCPRSAPHQTLLLLISLMKIKKPGSSRTTPITLCCLDGTLLILSSSDSSGTKSPIAT